MIFPIIAESTPPMASLRDFKRFVREAHERGLRVITELVINHTSDQHPWFQRARAAKPGSAARNFYVWANTDRAYKDAPIIFLDTEKSNWTWDDQAKAFYWHRFYAHQPDLNFDNPRVLEAVLDVMAYWLDMGVDGLRLDAIPYLVEREGTNCENLPGDPRGHQEDQSRGRCPLSGPDASRRGESLAGGNGAIFRPGR